MKFPQHSKQRQPADDFTYDIEHLRLLADEADGLDMWEIALATCNSAPAATKPLASSSPWVVGHGVALTWLVGPDDMELLLKKVA